jgi:biotin-(acetyl-CoA carboxylase) ligase
VGLNVNQTAAHLQALPAPAASLRQASGRPWDRGILLAGILRLASALYQRFCAGENESLLAEYGRRFYLQGRRVSVRDGASLRTGRVQGLAPDGGLLLEESGGQIRRILVGDVSVISVD